MLIIKDHKILEMQSHHCKDVVNLQIDNQIDISRNFWTLDELKELQKKEKSFCQVGICKRILTGFSIFFITDVSLEIYFIFVAPSFRKNGIGENFLKNAIFFCKKKLIKSIKLEVNEKNKMAINLYKKLNFKITGRRKNYYQIKGKYNDALLMNFFL